MRSSFICIKKKSSKKYLLHLFLLSNYLKYKVLWLMQIGNR